MNLPKTDLAAKGARFGMIALMIACSLTAGSPSQAQTGIPLSPTPPPPVTATAIPATVQTIHVVQRGENLFEIAQQYGTTVESIARANGIDNPAQISVGQRLLIPNAVPNAIVAVPGVPTDYIVGPGDSLLGLAWRYGTTIDQIARQNRIVNPATLFVGLPLSLQRGADGRSQFANGRVYTVDAGDTLYRAALVNGVSVTALRLANDLPADGALFPGQRLLIPLGKDGPVLLDVPSPIVGFSMLPAVAEQGRSFEILIMMRKVATISGTFMKHALVDHTDGDGLTHHILIGIDAFTASGIYPLQLMATDGVGVQTDLSRAIAVTDGGYHSEKIVLPPDQKDLLDPKVTQPELDKLLAIVGKDSAKRYFGKPFGLPVAAAITSPFGTRRSYDGGPFNQFHTGNDFGAPQGAPIFAPMAGVVVFTGPLHVRGNATIIDHGWGVFTGYWHQTTILVNVGDVVQAGQIIGKVGSTGRATGPHLHWEFFVGGVQVDSMQWTRLVFP